MPKSPELRVWIAKVVNDDPDIFPVPLDIFKAMDTNIAMDHLVAHFSSKTENLDLPLAFAPKLPPSYSDLLPQANDDVKKGNIGLRVSLDSPVPPNPDRGSAGKL